MANNRVYYAIQAAAVGYTPTPIHGLQSVGVTTNFNLEQVFELGQQAIYQNVEGIPDVEVTLNKVLDGYPLLYTMATETGSKLGATSGVYAATSPTIAGRSNARTDLYLGVFKDTVTSAKSGYPEAVMVCSGLYVSSVSYTFPVEGNFTEDLTLVGNSKIWSAGSSVSAINNVFGTAFSNNSDSPEALTGVGRRQYLNIANSRFPVQIPGISATGTNDTIGNGSGFKVHFQNITVSTDLGREPMYELGTMSAYHRYVTFPIEVTSEFEVLGGASGDAISASESGYYVATYGLSDTRSTDTAAASSSACTPRYNLRDNTIYLETCEGTKIWLGHKNKLTSVNYTGGDTGGGNVSITYSFQTFNDFTVAHSGGAYASAVGLAYIDSADGYNG